MLRKKLKKKNLSLLTVNNVVLLKKKSYFDVAMSRPVMSVECLSHVPIVHHRLTWLDSVYYEKRTVKQHYPEFWWVHCHAAGPQAECEISMKKGPFSRLFSFGCLFFFFSLFQCLPSPVAACPKAYIRFAAVFLLVLQRLTPAGCVDVWFLWLLCVIR
jgi:hypothetical protein